MTKIWQNKFRDRKSTLLTCFKIVRMIFQLFLHLLSLLWRGGYRQNQIEQAEVAYNLCLFYYNLFAIPISQTGVQRPPLVPKKRGRCSKALYIIKVSNGASKCWSLLTRGRYSEVVASTSLTVFLKFNILLTLRLRP